MAKKNMLSRVVFLLPIALFALAASSWSQSSTHRSAKPKAKTSAGTTTQGTSKPGKKYLLTYKPVDSKPVTVAFESQGVKEFHSAVKANDKAKIDEYLDFVSSEFENAKVECCEKRTKISSCVWSCCDGSKVDTCNSAALTEVVTMLWKKDG